LKKIEDEIKKKNAEEEKKEDIKLKLG